MIRMRRYMFLLRAAVVLVWLACPLLALPAAPVVSNVAASQDPNALTVTVHYDLSASGACAVTMLVSDNGGRFFSLVPKSLSGDIGDGVSPGNNKVIVWNALADMPNTSGSDFRVRVIASTGGQGVPPNGHTMVNIPEGAFTMGDDSETSDERPAHEVYVSEFQMDT